MGVVRRIVIFLLLLPAIVSAGPAARALGAASAGQGDELCLSAASVEKGDRGDKDDGAAHLPCVECCLACSGSNGVPPNIGKEATLRRAYFPASPLLETVTASGLGDSPRNAMWIRGPPSVAA